MFDSLQHMDWNPPSSSVPGIPRQEYWSGLPFLSPRDLPDPRIELKSPTLAGGLFTAKPPGKPMLKYDHTSMCCCIVLLQDCTFATYTELPTNSVSHNFHKKIWFIYIFTLCIIEFFPIHESFCFDEDGKWILYLEFCSYGDWKIFLQTSFWFHTVQDLPFPLLPTYF